MPKLRYTFWILSVALSLTASAVEEGVLRRCYFAPITPGGIFRMRQPDGTMREFARFEGAPEILKSVDGWTGRMTGDSVEIQTPAGQMPACSYTFEKGSLRRVKENGVVTRLDADKPVFYVGETIPPLWPDEAKLENVPRQEMASIWDRTKQLRLWFRSPHQAGAFLSFLFAAAFALALRRGIWGLHGKLLTALAALAVFMTASRGTLLACLLVVAVEVVCHMHVRGVRIGRRQLALLLTAVLAAGLVAFACFTTVRDVSKLTKSDNGRFAVWRKAPRMMCDAPGGWGRMADAGRAYSNWYCGPEESRVMLNLINDHLTFMVSSGWLASALYVFGWIAGILVLLRFAWRGGSPIPAAVVLALAVEAFFNVVMYVPWIMGSAVLSILALVPKRQLLRKENGRMPALFGILGAAVVLGAVYAIGDASETPRPAIRKSGEALLVNRQNPSVWLIADHKVLGYSTMESEIRFFYHKFPQAPGLGYVKRMEDVKWERVRRLVLTGVHCSAFLRKFSAGEIRKVPKEIVFLSPDISPSDIPAELQARSKVSVAIGEFALRYHPELVQVPAWVEAVRGAEVYIPGWLRFCFS